MTQEDNIYGQAIEYRDKYWKKRNPQIQEAAEFGYTTGAKGVLESEEYLQMKEKAAKYDEYTEEIESLKKKLSLQAAKVEKWDKLSEDVANIQDGEDYDPDEILDILMDALG